MGKTRILAASILALTVLIACRSGSRGDSEILEQLPGVGERACEKAERLAATMQPIEVKRRWTCQSLTDRIDRDHPRGERTYRGRVNEPEACLLEVTKASGKTLAILVDLHNDLHQNLALRGGDQQDFWTRDSGWHVKGVSKRFDTYHFVPETGVLKVDRQVTGVGQHNLYWFTTLCLGD